MAYNCNFALRQINLYTADILYIILCRIHGRRDMLYCTRTALWVIYAYNYYMYVHAACTHLHAWLICKHHQVKY